ncbi:MAG: energy transducer TonB [Caulobacterales bacterium]
MRWILAAVGASLLLTGRVAAADVSDPVWVQAPDRTEWAKAYPAAAASAGVEGQAHIKCSVTDTGLLSRCAVLDEAPMGQGFGAAALSLAPGMQMGPHFANGQPSAGKDVVVPVRFTPALMHPGAIVTQPDWMKRPDPEDLAKWWPAAARGGGGQAKVSCVVTSRGLLDKCTVISESPANEGFGQAALLLTPSFLMRPMSIDGLPVGGAEVNIPIHWIDGGPQEGVPERVAQHLPWSQTPTAAQMAAAFPAQAVGHVASGHVVLNCHVIGDGVLKMCESSSEEPAHHGFASAAIALSKDFKVAINPEVLRKVNNLYINLPFDFRDPSQPVPPLEVVDPLWLRGVDPKAAGGIFPDAAAKAGLKTGIGVVVCEVAHDGTLANCAVDSEDPPGMGFGKTALAIAGVMQMNPWTQQGAPVDGAHVRIPIRLNLAADAPAAATPAKP